MVVLPFLAGVIDTAILIVSGADEEICQCQPYYEKSKIRRSATTKDSLTIATIDGEPKRHLMMTSSKFPKADFFTLCCAIVMTGAFVFMPWLNTGSESNATALRLQNMLSQSDIQPSLQDEASMLWLISCACLVGTLSALCGLLNGRYRRLASRGALLAGLIGLAYYAIFFYIITDSKGHGGVGFWVALLAAMGLVLQVDLPRLVTPEIQVSSNAKLIMKDDAGRPIPRWFAFWRTLILVAVSWLVICLGASISLLLNLVPYDGFFFVYGSGSQAFLAGAALGLLVIVCGIVLMLVSRTRRGLAWRRFLVPTVALIGLGILSMFSITLPRP